MERQSNQEMELQAFRRISSVNALKQIKTEGLEQTRKSGNEKQTTKAILNIKDMFNTLFVILLTSRHAVHTPPHTAIPKNTK